MSVGDGLGEERLRHVLRLTLVGWVLGLTVTGVVVWSPHVLFGYRSPAVHLVLDSVDGCVALLVAYLLAGRFKRRRRLHDLLLAQGLVLLTVAGTGMSWLTGSLTGDRDGSLSVWLPLALRFIGAALIVAAALVTPDRESPSRLGLRTVTVPAALVILMSLVLWAARTQLPVAVDPSINTASQPLLFAAHPLFFAAQAMAAFCFFVASIAFTRRAANRDDSLLYWLGPACAVAAFARVNYALFPSLHTDWFYTGDLLRTGFYVLLLFGASREIKQYWDAYARVAVLEDRRRLSRELHDGVIQELALLRMEGHSLPPNFPARSRILAACDRSLDEARAAVHALGHGGDEPLGVVLHRTTRELAQRYRVSLDIQIDDSIEAASDQQHTLLRIIREAVANAARHGHARHLSVRLGKEGDRRRLVVEDDGEGFDVGGATGANAGYGLVSMRERARNLPGDLDITSRPGEGSVVTVTW
ncbi:sensor histidine kinase [Arthrobacter sp. SLBN-122]|uniref:sensor histidine kinase n=1 Tax=Arthrobacter sp. SLBN-122 TaxID=2768455 RepID=UPI00115279C0|nr:sensor histidine kinase [Arthrobacter sp. SLBN-122]TQJ36302.1 signal transduction histidine kinase [Arthrobacter sp. SLBN-122]